MIRPHLSVQHYVTRVTMDSGECINHCNETKRKSPQKIRDIFSHVTIRTNVTTAKNGQVSSKFVLRKMSN